MRRGRTVIYLVLIVVVLVIFAVIYFILNSGGTAQAQATPTPEIRYLTIVTADQYIYPGTPITAEMLPFCRLPGLVLPDMDLARDTAAKMKTIFAA